MIDPWTKGASGAAGALLWIVLVHGVDLSQSAIKGEIRWRPTLQRVLGVLGFFVCYLVLGLTAAFLTDAGSIKTAVIAGLGWQGVFGHFVKPRTESPPSI